MPSTSSFIMKAYRFVMRTSPAQERQLRRYVGQMRMIWNFALAKQNARHARGEKYAGHAEMCKWLTAWRNAPDTCWLAEGPSQPQQQILKRLDDAHRSFIGKKGGTPKFKAWGQEPGIRFPTPKQFELDQTMVGERNNLASQDHLPQAERRSTWCDSGRVKLPKTGWVRLLQSRQITGQIRNITITREGHRWFCSTQTVAAQVMTAPSLSPSLGLGLGVAVFAATSEGVLVAPLNALKAQQCRLRRYQRALARKVTGSSNRKKSVARLVSLHRRIARQRKDWLHKLSSTLTSQHPVIAIEDLPVKRMSASADGGGSAPVRNVNVRAGLNKSILDQGWAEFRRQLEYKLAAVGGRVIAVNPAFTSTTCRRCGHRAKGNRKTQAVFSCVACGHREHADVHAARVILMRALREQEVEIQVAAGHAASACGGDVRHGRRASASCAAPVNQEPTEVARRGLARA
jgi:putative transposase